MAVDSMARPMPRPYGVLGQLQVRPVWLVAALLVAIPLVAIYVALSSQVAAANEQVQRLETQLRAERARGDQLQVEIAELRSLERIVPIGLGQLNMRPPTTAALTFVAMPRLAAATTDSAAPTTPWAGRSGGSIGAGGWPGSQAGPVAAKSRLTANATAERNWWERLVALITPGSAAASEDERSVR